MKSTSLNFFLLFVTQSACTSASHVLQKRLETVAGDAAKVTSITHAHPIPQVAPSAVNPHSTTPIHITDIPSTSSPHAQLENLGPTSSSAGHSQASFSPPPHSPSTDDLLAQALAGYYEPRPVSRLQRLKASVSLQFQKLSWFFERIRLSSVFSRSSSPRFFSHAQALEKDFGVLQGLSREEIYSRIKPIVDDLASKPKFTTSFVKGKAPDAASTAEMLAKASKTLGLFASKREEWGARSVEITQALKPHISKGSERNMFKLMAKYQSEQLQQAQAVIANQLNKPIKSLASLHGLLGPQEVLDQLVLDVLKNKDFLVKSNLPDKFIPESFVTDLKELRQSFGALITHEDRLHTAQVDRLGAVASSHGNLIDILAFDHKYSQMVMPAGGYSELASKIRQSDVYKEAMLDLKRPNNDAGNELMLLEPMGIARSRDAMHFDAYPFKKFGYSSSGEATKTLDRQLNNALSNVQARMQINVEAREIKEELLQHFTPTGLASLVKQLNPKPVA